MITTQQILDKIATLEKNSKELKEFNKTNGTDIVEFKVDKTDTYCVVDVVTKKFTYDIELFDETDGYCNYNLQLKETAWEYDFDDWVADGDDIRYMFQLEGELKDYDDVELALIDMLPERQSERELEGRVKYLIGIRKRMQDCHDESSDNDAFLISFVKRICDYY